jgi:hypothetical protein
MTTTTTTKLTGLQRRVYDAIDNHWAELHVVGQRCGWGGEGCRRTPCGLWLVACSLQRHGLVETKGRPDRVKRVRGAK